MSLSMTKGFTLIEFLVTCGILGILSSISIAMFDTYRQEANDISAIASLRSFYTAFEAGSIPSGDATNGVARISFSTESDIHCDNFSAHGSFGCSGTGQEIAKYLPGYVHSPNVQLSIIFASNVWYSMVASHCRGTRSTSNPLRLNGFGLTSNFKAGKISKYDGSGMNYGGSDCSA